MRLRVTLRLRPVEEEVGALRDLLDAAGRVAGFDEAPAAEVVLAVHEALANVLKHGYGGDRRGPVTVRVRADEEALDVLIVDSCPPVSPDKICARDWDDRRPGGMGVPLIRRVMDVVEHRPRPGRGNVLHLRRTRRDAAGKDDPC
jgi:anti-sigma regulatory factor (Ser/Thr protein kinase)